MSDGRIADELAVRGLVARYCHAILAGDDDAWADTWAEDGEWQVIGRTAKGREAVLALYRELVGPVWVRQSASDGVIEIQGDLGTGRWMVSELVKIGDGPALQNFGIYLDDYRRAGDGWRFARRRFQPVYMGPPDLSGSTLPLP